VLQKLQKTYPHIFTSGGATASTYEAGASGNKYQGRSGPSEQPQPWRAAQQPSFQGTDSQGWSGSQNLNCYNSKTSANVAMSKGLSGGWNVEPPRFNINSQNFVASNKNVASGSASK